ncbi:MAG: tetratricopeptide repeat protein [Rhabdochlamydiaceae bacterium]
MSVHSYSSSSFLDAYLIETGVLKEINKLNKKIDNLCIKTSWPRIQEAETTSSEAKKIFCEIGDVCVDFYQYAYEHKTTAKKVNCYWEKALLNYQKCCDYPTQDKNLNSKNWMKIADLYLLYLRNNHGNSSSLNLEHIPYIQEGLKAINQALTFKKDHATLHKKIAFICELQKYGEFVSENPMNYWPDYLQSHPHPQSQGYIEKECEYGFALIQTGHFKEAKEWLSELKNNKEHARIYYTLAIACYCLLKEEDLTTGCPCPLESEALEYTKKAFSLDPDNLEMQCDYGFDLIQTGHFKEAKEWLSELKNNKANARIYHTLAIACYCLLKEEDLTAGSPCPLELETRDYINKALSLAPSNQEMKCFKENISQHLRLKELYLLKDPAHADEMDSIIEDTRKLRSSFPTPPNNNKLLADVYVSHGYYYLDLDDFEKAKKYLTKAIQLDPKNIVALRALAIVFAETSNLEKFNALAEEAKNLHRQDLNQQDKEDLSGFFYNIAIGLLRVDPSNTNFNQMIEYLKLSQELNDKHLPTQSSCAQILVYLDKMEEAYKLLKSCYDKLEDNPLYYEEFYKNELLFGSLPADKHKAFFCYAAILALRGDLIEAKKVVIKAHPLKINPDEIGNLERYISRLENKNIDNEPTKQQIKQSIYKLSFDYRIGKLSDEKSLVIPQGSFVGYHGTTDMYAASIIQEIKPQKNPTRQFKGKGFYLAEDIEIASYFAMKKAKHEKEGHPVILKIFAEKELIGKQSNYPRKNDHRSFDFISNKISGFEKFSQFYVMENSLKKIKANEEIEKFLWSDSDYEKFQNDWKRS